MDSTLLRFSSCFSITYAIFTIITGSLAREDSLGHLHIANGTLEIIQIVLQLIFLFNLKEKVKLKANLIEWMSLLFFFSFQYESIAVCFSIFNRFYDQVSKLKNLVANIQYFSSFSIYPSGWC